MKCLIVVPSNIIPGTISAPLAWLFADHVEQVHGIYGHELNVKLVKGHDRFIIELNWFTQLYEFSLIVSYIKRHNPSAKVLFGGLYSNLKYKEIFDRMQVDYFIKGDNEFPMKQFLDGVAPRQIPNFVGRDFDNEQTYHFTREDHAGLRYDLDWFPSFLEATRKFLKTPADVHYRNHFPIYSVPMIFSTKGGCLSRHSGCGYCLGARHEVMRRMYGRDILTLENDTAITLLHRIAAKFDAATLFIMSEAHYDFRGEHFDLHVTVEFDSMASVADVANIMGSFTKANIHVALYDEGLTGKTPRQDIQGFLELEDDDHKVYFFSNVEDAEPAGIPKDRRLYSESVLPQHTNYMYYINMDTAMAVSAYFFEQLMIRSFFLIDPLSRRIKTTVDFVRSNIPRLWEFLRYKGDFPSYYVDHMVPEVDKICLRAHEERAR